MIRYSLPSYQAYNDNLAELDGFWEVVKSLPGEIGGLIKKIDPEQVLKAGEIIAKFKEGKRGKGRDVVVEYFPKGRGDAGGIGISTTTLILVAGGAGLLVYLLVRGQK